MGTMSAALSRTGRRRKTTNGKKAITQLRTMYWGSGHSRCSSIRTRLEAEDDDEALPTLFELGELTRADGDRAG